MDKIWVMVVGLAVLACGEDTRSADLEVAIPAGTPTEIGVQPELQVGSAEGDSGQALFRVVNPLLVNGRVVIPMADGRVQVYDSTGRFTEVLGGSGRGPGEFEWLTAAWMRGDTLEAHDAPLQRITRFAPDRTIEVVQLENVVFMPSAKGPVEDGWILASIANSGGDRPQRSRDTLVLRHHGLDGSHSGEIHRTAGLARYRNAEGKHVPEPLSPAVRVRTHAGEIYVGETLAPSITVLNSHGTVLRELSWSTDASSSPKEAFEEVKEKAIAGADPDEVVETRTRLQSAPAPELVSVWWDFLVDELGFVWIRPYDVLKHAHELGSWRGAGPGGEWLVLDPDGNLVSTIEVPADLELTHVTTSTVVGISRDDFDVESVSVYPLTRSGRPE
ncbi:MAG: hypothetical protein LC667_13850 [Thioalkalivibrio sp.]|nr:hypothetical protein [Thioalkalivibrio sp.]